MKLALPARVHPVMGDTNGIVPRGWRIPLLVAGLHDCALAAYHFFLPYHMQWRRGLDDVADSLVWALFALNFSWSLLVLVTGALVVYASSLGPAAGTFARVTIFSIGLFWLIHGLYTWLNPLPLPRSLMWLRLVLGFFPAVVVALHWWPLFLTWRSSHSSAQRSAHAL